MLDRLRQWLRDLLARCFPSRPDPPPIPDYPPIPAPWPAPPRPPSPEAQVVNAINAARAPADLPPLFADRSLGGMAWNWAASMASEVGLSHGDFAGRITAAYPNRAGGEDIAGGQTDAASVVAAWMDSPHHRANILGDFDRIGVGSARDPGGVIYWCADFVKMG